MYQGGGTWEEVVPRRKRVAKADNTVSVITTGEGRLTISLRGRFKEIFADYDYVRVLIDVQGRRMLLKPSDYEEGKVYKITRTKSGTYIHCISALRRLGVSPGRYPARWNDELGGLVIYFSVPEHRPEREDLAWRLLHEPDDWGPGTENASRSIDEFLYGGR